MATLDENPSEPGMPRHGFRKYSVQLGFVVVWDLNQLDVSLITTAACFFCQVEQTHLEEQPEHFVPLTQ